MQPAKRAALAAAIAKSGIPAAGIRQAGNLGGRIPACSASSSRISASIRRPGVESVLKKQFKAGGKPIGQLETNAEQLGFFDRLSEDAQRKFLDGVLEDPAAMKKQFGGMLDAWSRGDVKGIADSFNSDLGDAPELKDALLVQAQRQLGATGSRAGSTSPAP